MARKSESFNLTEVIREYRRSHPGSTANAALQDVKKSHPGERINEGTFRTTFYKLSGSGGKRTVTRRKPRRGSRGGNGDSDMVMRAGLTFIRLAGGVDNAKERLASLNELIETAKAVQ
jgi:hypothetical protein